MRFFGQRHLYQVFIDSWQEVCFSEVFVILQTKKALQISTRHILHKCLKHLQDFRGNLRGNFLGDFRGQVMDAQDMQKAAKGLLARRRQD
jgi:hypothetical protein